MARRFTGNAANVLTAAVAPVTAVPISFSAWVLCPLTSNSGEIISVSEGSGGSSADNFQLAEFGSIAQASQFTTTASGAVSSASAGSAVTSFYSWNHYGGASSGIASRFAYFNGKAGTESTTSRTPTGINSTSIGALKGTGGAFTNAIGSNGSTEVYICEVGMWNVALTQAEFNALASGVRVSNIRPGSLIGYWLPFDEQCSGGNARCYAGKSGLILAATGVVPNNMDKIPPVFRRSKTYFDYKGASVTPNTGTTSRVLLCGAGM